MNGDEMKSTQTRTPDSYNEQAAITEKLENTVKLNREENKKGQNKLKNHQNGADEMLKQSKHGH